MDQLLIHPLTRCFRSKSSRVLIPRMPLSLLQAKAMCKSRHSSDAKLCSGHFMPRMLWNLKLISSYITWERKGCIRRKLKQMLQVSSKQFPRINFNNPWNIINEIVSCTKFCSNLNFIKRNKPFIMPSLFLFSKSKGQEMEVKQTISLPCFPNTRGWRGETRNRNRTITSNKVLEKSQLWYHLKQPINKKLEMFDNRPTPTVCMETNISHYLMTNY